MVLLEDDPASELEQSVAFQALFLFNFEGVCEPICFLAGGFIFFLLTPSCRNDPIWLTYFSDGFKPLGMYKIIKPFEYCDTYLLNQLVSRISSNRPEVNGATKSLVADRRRNHHGAHTLHNTCQGRFQAFYWKREGWKLGKILVQVLFLFAQDLL